MSEDKTDIESETDNENEIDIENVNDIEKLVSELHINSWDDLFKVLCIVKGIDPNQVQSMAKFSNLDNIDERSYYPNQLTSLAISQLRMLGKTIYPNSNWNEYELMADLISSGFMGYHGFKSEQFVNITSGQPNFDKLRALPEDTQKAILAGIFNRGNRE